MTFKQFKNDIKCDFILYYSKNQNFETIYNKVSENIFCILLSSEKFSDLSKKIRFFGKKRTQVIEIIKKNIIYNLCIFFV